MKIIFGDPVSIRRLKVCIIDAIVHRFNQKNAFEIVSAFNVFFFQKFLKCHPFEIKSHGIFRRYLGIDITYRGELFSPNE
jgi:hypothetical protein